MKTIKIITYIFTAISLIILLFGINITWNNITFIKNGTETQGKVIGFKEKESTDSEGDYQIYYYPIVEYSDATGNLHVLESRLGTGSPDFEVGQVIEILYLPNNPGESKIATFGHLWGSQIILFILGAVFLTIGLLVDYFFVRKDKRMQKKAQKYSAVIHANVIQVRHNTNLKVNGKSPFQIHAQWFDNKTNQKHQFKSKNFWFNPADFLGETITVKADPSNYKKYWMDTTFIPAKVK